MRRQHIMMIAYRRPEQPFGEIVFSFPAKQYPLKQVCGLFMHECLDRILAQQRQAIDVQLVLEDNKDMIIRCVARLGGMDRLDFDLIKTREYGASGTMPDDQSVLDAYRGLNSFGKAGWDVVYHGERYPSKPEDYAAALEKFFKSGIKRKHDEL